MRKIGYVGAANGDAPERIERFFERFQNFADELVPLPAASEPDHAASWIKDQDLVYLAGGDLFALQKMLRRTGLDRLIVESAQKGTIVAGVSAGAMCWFEFALSRAGGLGLRPEPGIGVLKGSCCPHYTEEPERRAKLELSISNGSLPSGIAIGDGACVVQKLGCDPEVFCARSGSGAWFVERVNNSCRVRSIKTIK